MSTEVEQAMAQRRAEAEEYRARVTTISLTNEEWHAAIAACYRAVMDDAQTLLNADEMDVDPEGIMQMMARTVSVRTAMHKALHAGEDQARWRPARADEEEGEEADAAFAEAHPLVDK